ncbi:DUF998 domain-containing protein [Hamadaea tsunoensis]|uniref:DUF998 domain-containing protein n=1 Tax=Hamadaea tsunoensis TaxID=53368 RepID=UPI00146FB1EF|nr:DUF998 domain-containing protein [Hamadaea tsunoensis]
MTDTAIRPTGVRPAERRPALNAGAAAGPLFLAVAILQAVTRPGFDLLRHPVSLLSLGDLGWLQIANFIATGLLFLAGAVGLRRSLGAGPASRWAPILVGTLGVALVVGGVFTPDPALAFPPGTPDGRPATMSFHGTVHAIAPAVGFVALAVACFVMARRFSADGRRATAVTSWIVGAVVFVLSGASNVTGQMGLLWLALVVGLGWSAVMLARPAATVSGSGR